MNVPTIGGPKGIFEIFLPGVFLLLNLGMAIFLFPFSDDETKQFIVDIGSNPALLLIIAIGFGYLFGVLLRLLRLRIPDDLSAAWLRRFHPDARLDGKYELWATEDFPYIRRVEQLCKQFLSSKVLDFYNEIWKDRRQDNKQNRSFFNLCKMMIYSEDERAANEIYAAEAMCRYISGMFYALVLSCGLLFSIVVLYIASGQIFVGLIAVLCAYLCALVVIMKRFRFMRLKEVETVFFASFRNRSIFEGMAETADKG
jgi:hypothetical protein